jgi:hypothetical protein
MRMVSEELPRALGAHAEDCYCAKCQRELAELREEALRSRLARLKAHMVRWLEKTEPGLSAAERDEKADRLAQEYLPRMGELSL